jgi:hypothetical protein
VAKGRLLKLEKGNERKLDRETDDNTGRERQQCRVETTQKKKVHT